MKTESEVTRPQYPKIVGLLLVAVSMIAIVVLYVLDISFLYEPKYLLGVTNTLFTAIIPVIVAFFAARTYLKTGSFSVLLMGCGMLGFGLCAASAGWLRQMGGGANFNVTIYNTGALLGSVCHFAGAVFNYSRKSYYHWELRKQKLAVIPAYSVIILFAVLLSFATVQQVVPPFFIQESGPTPLRQIVLGLAILLYALSSLFFMNNFIKVKSDFLYWYSLCLAMLALGLFAFYIQRIVGSPIGWVGRTSNYVGTVFSLVAILAAARSGKIKGLPLEEIISGFFMDAEANYRSLVETASDAIISFDQENRIILWNPSAERIFGYSKAETIGSPIFSMFMPEEHENTLTALVESSRGLSSQRTIEISAKHKSGFLIPIETSGFKRKLPGGSATTIIIRDITERKLAEGALRESEARFRSLFENMTEGVALHELVYDSMGTAMDYRILTANPAFEKQTGLALERCYGQLASALYGTGCAPYLDVYAGVENSGEPCSFETYFPPMERHFHISVSSPKGGQFVTVFEDITERKQAEEALRESEARFRILFDTMSEGFSLDEIICDEAGKPCDLRYLKVNPAFELHTGLKAADIEGRTTLELFPETEPVWFERYGKVALTGKPAHFEAFFGPLGQYFRVSAYRTESGRFAVVFSDITERKLMEEALRKSRDDLELRVRERTEELVEANRALSEKAEIIDLAHDAIIVRDAESRITFWSRGARETYGFTRQEALGRVSNELLRTVSPVPIENIAKTVLEKGEWKGELKHTKANGERIIVDSRWAVQAGEGDEAPVFLEVNRDITPRKIIEEEFRKADRAFRTLSECNQVLVRQTEEMELLQQICRIVVDVGGYRMAWVGFAENDENKTVLPIASAGYDQGYLDQARITWADTERGRGPTGTAIRTGKIITSQNALLNPAYSPWSSEGTRRGYAASIALPLIVERNVIGTLTIYASEPDAFDEGEAGLLSNLAENLAYGIASIRVGEQRKRSGEELRVYASRLEVINKELQDFAFVASHDLQEPLRKIQTFCDMAMKRCSPALDSAGKEYLDRVLASASRMRQLLRDLLAFSRVAKRLEPFQKLKLHKVAREAAEIFEASFKETDCRIEIEDLPAIEADESQMLQLFQNLIGNALKYRSDETPHIRVYSKSDRQGCEILVKDNGIGFDQRYAELVFKPFQRLHGRGEYDGTGMGLAICRKIVERHGGSITAESEPGKGSTFVIRLPVKQTCLETAIAISRS